MSDTDFHLLLQKIDIDQSGDIQKEEFIHAVQELTLRARLFGSAQRYEVNKYYCQYKTTFALFNFFISFVSFILFYFILFYFILF